MPFYSPSDTSSCKAAAGRQCTGFAWLLRLSWVSGFEGLLGSQVPPVAKPTLLINEPLPAGLALEGLDFLEGSLRGHQAD